MSDSVFPDTTSDELLNGGYRLQDFYDIIYVEGEKGHVP